MEAFVHHFKSFLEAIKQTFLEGESPTNFAIFFLLAVEVPERCYIKNLFLKNSQSLQENSCDGILFQ